MHLGCRRLSGAGVAAIFDDAHRSVEQDASAQHRASVGAQMRPSLERGALPWGGWGEPLALLECARPWRSALSRMKTSGQTPSPAGLALACIQVGIPKATFSRSSKHGLESA